MPRMKGNAQLQVTLWVKDYVRRELRQTSWVIERNWRFHPERKFEVDIGIPAIKVGIEVDGYGGGHQLPKGFTRDREKDAEAWLVGWHIFRFSTTQVQNGSAFTYLEKILQRLVRRYGSARAGEPKALVDLVLAYEGDECIIWPFSCAVSGYGRIKVDREYKDVHVLVCERVHGPRPPGYVAAHSCGVAGCVNHRHIRWATHSENHDDMWAHGTIPRGEAHENSKLTEAQALEIYHSTESATALGRRYGVTRHAVEQIRKGHNWKWLTQSEVTRGN